MAHLVLLSTRFLVGFLTEDLDEGRSIALLAALALIVSVTSAWAQTTGEIFGKVTDESGAVLPGVQVTLTGPVLLQPLTAVTSETGTYPVSAACRSAPTR